MVNWSEYTKLTLPFICSNTTQDKTKADFNLADFIKKNVV